MASDPPSSKKTRTHPPYELLYHPGIPGRGEFIRLLLEGAGVPYTDLAVEKKDGYAEVQKICMDASKDESSEGNPPVFAPPALRVKGARGDGGTLVISQTPNILNYLGPATGMAGNLDAAPEEQYLVAEVAMTALDLNNEVHDTHHPIGPSLYYEDQKAESKRKATDFRDNRLPKFCSYFGRTLNHNSKTKGGEGKYMVGSQLTFADTTVWQVLDGLFFAFPKEMAARKGEYKELLQTFYNSVKEEKGIKEYLGSGRRMEYSMGVFRHYPELDRQD